MAQATRQDKWDSPKLDKDGFQVGDDKLPPSGVARAMALAKAGKKTDPKDVVSDEMIAAHDPKKAEADKKAAAKFNADQAADQAAAKRAKFEEAQPSDDAGAEEAAETETADAAKK